MPLMCSALSLRKTANGTSLTVSSPGTNGPQEPLTPTSPNSRADCSRLANTLTRQNSIYSPFGAGSQTYVPDAYKGSTGMWEFSSDPTSWLQGNQGVTFNPGQGEGKLKSAVKSVGPILAMGAAPFAAAALAGAAGYGSGISGMSGMGLLGGASGAAPVMGYGGLAGQASGVGGGSGSCCRRRCCRHHGCRWGPAFSLHPVDGRKLDYGRCWCRCGWWYGRWRCGS